MTEEKLKKKFQSKIKVFFNNNFKNLIILLIFSILILFSYFFYKDLQKKKEVQLSSNYTQATIQFNEKNTNEAKQLLEKIISENHKFYSPLALYFIIENNLEKDSAKILNFFDEILLIDSIDKENLNLIKIKKAIFLFNLDDEKAIIKSLNPIINSDSIWRNLSIKLMSDYLISKDQKLKANEYIELLNSKIKK
jgi:predicted negative regulator of RcsB-dependent stress response|tara:strand:+ start:850 stop:1431 length:582 start_codon:yes stop_codon:yes gene_type:complete